MGRYIIIDHVLQSMSIYILSATNPLTGVINQLHRTFARFFGETSTGERNKNWVLWENVCYPKEGGIGLKSLHMISKELCSKLR